MNSVKIEIKDQIWGQVGDYVWWEVSCQIHHQVEVQVWGQVGDLVWPQVERELI